MKIKLKSNSLLVLISMIGFLYSCSTSNSVVSNRLVSKRKYTDGFHYNGKVTTKSSDNVAKTEEEPKRKNEFVTVSSNALTADQTSKSVEQTVASENLKLDAEILSEKSDVTTLEVVSTKKDVNKTKNSFSGTSTSEKNTLKKTIHHKAEKAQVNKAEIKKALKQNNGGDQAILYIILCILIPFVAVGLATDWDVLKVVICLLLSFLFWIPGIIYAFIVCSQEGVL